MNNQRKQNRLKTYDYAQPGYYFVTVCTNHRKDFFGIINENHLILNDLGIIAQEVWLRTPIIYQNVKIDEFVIMPNHMHGIVIIEEGQQVIGKGQTKGLSEKSLRRYISLSQIIGSYKNVVSKTIRDTLSTDFAWQPSFYDHVIRKEEVLDKIREYIRNNPLKWEIDRNNISDLWM